jgi:UDP-glucose 4-epimerase
MSNYLVTGGAGFIGSHIVEALVREGHSVRVLDNFSTGRLTNLTAVLDNVDVITGDVCELQTVKSSMRNVDYVLHQAAIVSVTQSVAEPASTHRVTAGGTLNILMAARDAGVRRVVCASTCAVYGDNPNVPLSESELPRPQSPYAAAKLTGEIYGMAFRHVYDLPVVFLRYFNVYGPRQNPKGDYAGVIAKFMGRMTAGQTPTIFGDGQQTRDFINVNDVVRASNQCSYGPIGLANRIGGCIELGAGHALDDAICRAADWRHRSFGCQYHSCVTTAQFQGPGYATAWIDRFSRLGEQTKL